MDSNNLIIHNLLKKNKKKKEKKIGDSLVWHRSRGGRAEREWTVEGEAMTDTLVKAAVDAIHLSPTQAVLYLSGGASQVSI